MHIDLKWWHSAGFQPHNISTDRKLTISIVVTLESCLTNHIQKKRNARRKQKNGSTNVTHKVQRLANFNTFRESKAANPPPAHCIHRYSCQLFYTFVQISIPDRTGYFYFKLMQIIYLSNYHFQVMTLNFSKITYFILGICKLKLSYVW